MRHSHVCYLDDFEILGTIAFAFSGAVVGLYRRMDIFGITVLAVMTGVGGGMIRDVLCGIIPPSALSHPTSLLVSIGTALFVSFLYPFFRIPKRGKVIISLFTIFPIPSAFLPLR